MAQRDSVKRRFGTGKLLAHILVGVITAGCHAITTWPCETTLHCQPSAKKDEEVKKKKKKKGTNRRKLPTRKKKTQTREGEAQQMRRTNRTGE